MTDNVIPCHRAKEGRERGREDKGVKEVGLRREERERIKEGGGKIEDGKRRREYKGVKEVGLRREEREDERRGREDGRWKKGEGRQRMKGGWAKEGRERG